MVKLFPRSPKFFDDICYLDGWSKEISNPLGHRMNSYDTLLALHQQIGWVFSLSVRFLNSTDVHV